MTGENHRVAFLTRHFLPLTGGVFFILFLAVLGIEWVGLRREAVRHAEDRALEMTRFLEMELQTSFPLPTILEGLSDPELYEYFDHLIIDKLTIIGLARAKIYNPEGEIVYATNHSLVGSTPEDHDEVHEASHGQVESEIIGKMGYRMRYGIPAPTQFIETYVPLPGTGTDGGTYVFEAYQDFLPIQMRYVRAFLASAVLTGTLVALAVTLSGWLYRRVHRLEATVETLEQLLPICASCKKIRVETEGQPDEWVAVEQYFEVQNRVAFSHGLCDDCVRKLYPDLADEVLSKKG